MYPLSYRTPHLWDPPFVKWWIYDKFFPPQASQATIPIEAYWRIFERLAYISQSIRWINVEFF